MEKFQASRARESARRQKAINGLLPEQIEAIHQAHEALKGALQMIEDAKDLYLSDIAKMETAFYQMRNNFELD
jgi:hypothetical protein